MRLKRIHAVCLMVFGLFSGCTYYSFSGASISESLRTIAISGFEDQSNSGQPALGEVLTQELINKFTRQTRLRLSQDEYAADVVLRGQIRTYSNLPTAVSGTEQVTKHRVTIEITATYINQQEQKEVFQRSFSQSAEYDPNSTGKSEYDTAKEALEKIANDVFTAATSDW